MSNIASELEQSIANIECIRCETDPADIAEVLELSNARDLLQDVLSDILHGEPVHPNTMNSAEYLVSIFVDIPLVEGVI